MIPAMQKPIVKKGGKREGWSENVPPNVWIGATICNQEEADRDIPKLLQVPAAKRFLSMEPLLGHVYLDGTDGHVEALAGWWRKVDWVIVGGESGGNARAMRPEWARSLRDQCEAASVAFHFKQWGEWAPNNYNDGSGEHMDRMGKKIAGRLLDGLEHNEFPSTEAALVGAKNSLAERIGANFIY